MYIIQRALASSYLKKTIVFGQKFEKKGRGEGRKHWGVFIYCLIIIVYLLFNLLLLWNIFLTAILLYLLKEVLKFVYIYPLKPKFQSKSVVYYSCSIFLTNFMFWLHVLYFFILWLFTFFFVNKILIKSSKSFWSMFFTMSHNQVFII